MKVVASSDFIKEFTLHADDIVDNNETFIVQRSNGKNLVVMSMEEFNKMQKQIYMASKSTDKGD